MSELIVVGLPDARSTDDVLAAVLRLEGAKRVELEDTALVYKDPRGRVRLRQSHNLPLEGALSGGFWGLLLGLLLGAPLAGGALGLALGALVGVFADIGIDDRFMKRIGVTLSRGTAAIFVLLQRGHPEEVVRELRRFGGKLLRTSLPHDAEERLRGALEEAEPPSSSSSTT